MRLDNPDKLPLRDMTPEEQAAIKAAPMERRQYWNSTNAAWLDDAIRLNYSYAYRLKPSAITAPQITLADAKTVPEVAALIEAVAAESVARRTYWSLPSDRGGASGPQGKARTKWLEAVNATEAALRQIGVTNNSTEQEELK